MILHAQTAEVVSSSARKSAAFNLRRRANVITTAQVFISSPNFSASQHSANRRQDRQLESQR
jgi:hypothetical protein